MVVLLVVFFMVSACSEVIPVRNAPANSMDVTQVDSLRLSATYTAHAPITISSNADFSAQGWPGSGTVDDPYVIEGLNITSDGTCISISGTDACFVIRDCFISSTEPNPTSGEGIKFSYVTHGTIESSLIVNTYRGIYLLSDVSTRIENVTVRAAASRAIYSSSSRSLVVTNCTVWDSEAGMYMSNANVASITNSTFRSNLQYGVYVITSIGWTVSDNQFFGGGLLFSASSELQVPDNASGNYIDGMPVAFYDSLSDTVVNISQYGSAILASCSNVTIVGGRITSGTAGVILAVSESCIVEQSVFASSRYGVFVTSSNFSMVRGCQFLDNAYTSIYVEKTWNFTADGNSIVGSGVYGISIVSCYNSTVVNNEFVKCGLVFPGITLDRILNDISNNTVNGRPLGYFVNEDNLDICASDYGQLFFYNCSTVLLRDGEIHLTSIPVVFYVTDYVTVRNVSTQSCRVGINIKYATNVTIENV
ncbi:MAG: right-handed parallel beta-helix repeat-containing protein [Candidatus Thorarchaeota archaeon]